LITSAANPRLKLVRRLASRQQRDRLGLFAVEGEDLVQAGLAAGLEPVELLVAGETITEEALASLSSFPHPARAIAVFRRADLPRYAPAPVTLALWHVADPGNVGTLLRSADAFGASVCLSSGCADPTGLKAARASAGALFRVPLGAFEEAAGRRVALATRAGTPLPAVELGERVVFVLGAERQGLPEEAAAACDERATIQTTGPAESLNVAAAGAIALYEWSRRAAPIG
jgi:TrmH family RNA methyltransferase